MPEGLAEFQKRYIAPCRHLVGLVRILLYVNYIDILSLTCCIGDFGLRHRHRCPFGDPLQGKEEVKAKGMKAN